MILYGIASETSIGRLFLAGVLPGLMLTGLFIAWALFLCWRRGDGALDRAQRYSLGQMLEMVPRVGPFIVLIAGVVYALYGGIATPSEAAGVGAVPGAGAGGRRSTASGGSRSCGASSATACASR